MTGKILTFYLCDKLFGIDITKVKEINRNANYVKVPLSEGYIAGLFNMRGQVVTIFNLAKLIGYEKCNDKTKSCIVLKLKSDYDDYIGFLIDKPGDVIDIKSEWCEPLSANLEEKERIILQELAKLNDSLIMIINSNKILNYNLKT